MTLLLRVNLKCEVAVVVVVFFFHGILCVIKGIKKAPSVNRGISDECNPRPKRVSELCSALEESLGIFLVVPRKTWKKNFLTD